MRSPAQRMARPHPGPLPRGSPLRISFPLDTVGIKAAIVAAQRFVRNQPRAEPSDALDASFGPRTCRPVAQVNIRAIWDIRGRLRRFVSQNALSRTAHPRSPHGLAVHGSSVNNLSLRFSAIARGRPMQSTASWPRPLCVSAPLRLCVGTDAFKTQSRKGARDQTGSRWPPNQMLSELSGSPDGSANKRKLIGCHRFSQGLV